MSIRNFDALFEPAAIALIGASNAPRSVGRVLADNLLGAGFAGPVMTVNPHETAIRSTLNYRSIGDLPITPDLAVVATPAAGVPAIIGDLGRRGCRAAVVISAGFGAPGEGGDLHQAMLDAAKPHLMRIVGPNCLGFISTPRGINASFAHLTPRPGNIALVSQSGAIVAAMLDWADQRGVGFSHILSLGDMSDVDFGDALDYLCADRATRSILLYVENVTHARKFMSAARIASRTKPVLVVKGGRSMAGAKAALSHTGALAGADAVYDAVFQRAGLLRVAELEELFAAAAILATGMRVSGDRMTILTNGGGAGVMAVDALVARGGRIAELGAGTLQRLDQALPGSWSHANPVDILGDATGERYAAALEILLEEPDSDAILVINCPTAVTDGQDAASAVAQAVAKAPARPVLTSWLGGTTAERSRSFLAGKTIPTFTSPEEAVRAFTHLVEFRRNQDLLLETPSAGVAIAPAQVDAARQLIETVRQDGRCVLTEPEAKRLLALFGIPAVETLVAATPEEAGRLFGTIGAPVALKILSPDISHKSDVGGVALSLRSQAEVTAAAHEMLARVRHAAPNVKHLTFTVQKMISRPKACELIVGIAKDPTFGPVLLFGRGGTATEVIGDRAIGLPPLNSVLAKDMIGRTRVSRLLAGYRDVPPVPLDAVADVLVRLSELVIHLPDVIELDINPLLADASGVVALDARVVITATSEVRTPLAISPYPEELGEQVTLNDGARFQIRPIRPDDEVALSDMVAQCTPGDLRLRFLAPLKTFPHEMAARLSQIDYDREMAFVAVEPDSAYGSGPIFGVVRLIGDPERDTAEFAVLVRSDMKGRGLGYRLMSKIVAHAKASGFKRLYGDVLRGNRVMLAMTHELGFRSDVQEAGEQTTRISIDTSS